MGRRMLLICATALLALPAAGAFAKVGNGTMQAPPGLQNAEDKIVAAIVRQMDNERARYDQQSAALQDDIDQVTALFGPDAASRLQDRLDALTARHEATQARLGDRLAIVTARFNNLIAAWQAKHGITPDDLPPK